jgi:hypothetical protein
LNRTDINFTKILVKVTYIGLFLNVLVPIGMFTAAAFLTGKNIEVGSGINFGDDDTLRIMFYGLLIVTAIDIVITYVIRKKMPERLLRAMGSTTHERFEKVVVNFSLIIFSFNLSYAIYGLVLVIIGAELEVMMLFMAFSLIGYQLFRPRQKYLERLIERVEQIVPQ